MRCGGSSPKGDAGSAKRNGRPASAGSCQTTKIWPQPAAWQSNQRPVTLVGSTTSENRHQLSGGSTRLYDEPSFGMLRFAIDQRNRAADTVTSCPITWLRMRFQVLPCLEERQSREPLCPAPIPRPHKLEPGVRSPMPDRFEGKVVVITGAAGGIGRATAVRFASEGASILAVDLPNSDLDETVAAV